MFTTEILYRFITITRHTIVMCEKVKGGKVKSLLVSLNRFHVLQGKTVCVVFTRYQVQFTTRVGRNCVTCNTDGHTVQVSTIDVYNKHRWYHPVVGQTGPQLLGQRDCVINKL